MNSSIFASYIKNPEAELGVDMASTPMMTLPPPNLPEIGSTAGGKSVTPGHYQLLLK